MLCVIAKLDGEATERLRSLQRLAGSRARAPFPIYGHITLAVYLPEDDEGFMRSCTGLIRGRRAFTVCYGKIDVLRETSVIAAIPSVPEEMRDLHDRIVRDYAPSLDQWTGGERWYPHTTLLHDPDADLDAIRRDMERELRPFDAVIRRIEFSRVLDTGYAIIDTVDLE